MHAWSVGDHLTHRFSPELGTGRVTAIDGRVLVVHFPQAGTTLRLAAASDALVPEAAPDSRRDRSLLDRLAAGEIDETEDFLTRIDILHLLAVREAGGLGSFLGGRVRLFPHQLHVAEHATARMPVRWLLADEVGLGKTIEAALILNKLVHTTALERVLVVVPEALTVQWLGELWRKYHQVFTLLDTARLADVARDFGSGFNPFDVHRRVVVALETLVQQPELTTQAVRAGIDLLVVDEAQRLRRPRGHPGEPGYRAIAPIAALGRHVLLLSATPLEDDAHGFVRLLQLLRPEEFPEGMEVTVRLASGAPLPPCTSSTRRTDIGGLPPRVPVPVDLPDAGSVDDPKSSRLEWLLRQARRWKRAGEKTLVFVARRETLDMLRDMLSARAQLASGLFHEELSAARRDVEVARFREAAGPSILVSTEAGGEGRNFEFCHRLVLFDLPWKPAVIEQRIGRLDRIGRRMPVEIVYFRPASGAEADVVQRFERAGIFHEPLTEARIAQLAGEGSGMSGAREAAYQQLHRDPYRAELAAGILARVPDDLDALMEQVVVNGAARLGFRVDPARGRRTYAVEFGNEAVVDSLPGVSAGATFIGSFDREHAVQDETIDFFSSGHPLVEGILAHFEDDAKGRVGRLALDVNEAPGVGVVAIYKDGPQFEVVAFDVAGRARPDWAAVFGRRPIRVRRMTPADVVAHDWARVVRQAGAHLDPARRPHALAALLSPGSEVARRGL